MNVIKGNVRYFASALKINAAVRVAQQGPVRIITMDRPKEKNAMNDQMWKGLIGAFTEAESDTNTNVIAIRGNVDIFCSGLDLYEYKQAVDTNTVEAYAKNCAENLRNLVSILIDSKKPIVGLVRGHAIGIGVTLLPLCDIVYASEKATFTTPFARLGIVAECCSSYTFPKIMGYAHTGALIYDNQTITAEQAHQRGLVSHVLLENEFDPQTTIRVDHLAILPVEPLLYSKKLVRDGEREILHAVNKKESEVTEQFLQGQDLRNAVENFLKRKK